MHSTCYVSSTSFDPQSAAADTLCWHHHHGPSLLGSSGSWAWPAMMPTTRSSFCIVYWQHHSTGHVNFGLAFRPVSSQRGLTKDELDLLLSIFSLAHMHNFSKAGSRCGWLNHLVHINMWIQLHQSMASTCQAGRAAISNSAFFCF